ncbi:MAG: PIG-L family deacetylase [Acidobacteriales bacterium]|nr:PIG-L family deacetylase [Terriglobales bacterium]
MPVHLFLSPHLDDAVLSCGGVIHQLTQRGERVVIMTVMAGEPPDNLPDTPPVQAVKARWGAGHILVSTRRTEDIRAARRVGAKVVHLPLLECLFRTARSGDGTRTALYPKDDSPFSEYKKTDDARVLLLESQSCVREGVVTIYAPLCADHHIDHRLVRDWALVLTGAKNAPVLKFYEEYPSIRNKMALNRVMLFYKQYLPALSLTREMMTLTQADVTAKIQALRCYESHVQVLWQSLDEMEKSVGDYLLFCGEGRPAEQFWAVSVTAPTDETARTVDIIP